MKRIVALVLLAALLIPLLCGCKKDKNTAAPEGDYQVGYAAVEVMPKTPVSLAGYGNYARRVSTNKLDTLYASCIAVTDKNDETLLIIGGDTIRYSSEMVKSIRVLISFSTGVPQDHILMNASHSHSTPETNSVTSGVGTVNYSSVLSNGTIEAAKLAMEDRSPASMRMGKTDIPGMNFVKHYIMNDGSYGGDNFGDFSSGIAGHAHEVDPEMRLVLFTREGKDDVLMYNWQGHPLITGGINKTDISADYIGSTRTAFQESNPGIKILFLQGCAGDTNVRSNIPEEQPTQDNTLFGELLASYITAALPTLEKVPGGEVKANQVMFVGQVDHTEDHLVDVAKPIQSYFSQTGDRTGGNEMCKAYGLNSVYHAGAIITKAGLPATLSFEIDAYQVGELAIITTPMEYFSQLGKDIRDRSEYDLTFTLGYTNGYISYMPTRAAFAYKPYEANQCRFVAGTGEDIADKLVEMLAENRK